jgi:hypothetical protein
VNAIGGTGINAIGGTGVNAIGGTGVNAIGGTGRSQLVILGPVESVDLAQGTVTILGRTLQLPKGPTASSVLERYVSGESLQVAVLGALSTAGRIAHLTLQVVPTPYVPGVSEVVLTGVVQAVDLATGQAMVNDTVVSYTSLLETGASAMNVGTVVTVRGTMPQAGQAIDASVLVIHGR